MSSADVLHRLVGMTQALASPVEDLVILAEGNTSAAVGEGAFWVKASGCSMVGIQPSQFVLLDRDALCAAISGPTLNDGEARALLNGSRVDPECPEVPSTEALMHAWLLSLPGVGYVGHTHPTPLLGLLCVESARRWAGERLFPDEVVCCGPRSCFVDYVAPGFPLAVAIATAVTTFREDVGIVPKTLWLANHGLIALGATPEEVLSASRMTVKAARARVAALAAGEPVRALTAAEIDFIYRWPDEHFRQQRLFGR
ncbi:MAG TPA: class II aldolase/adducin family protein [Fimbriimonadaceae bacterium]|nr:class II aldolase/adducin family protein [Fimbriimonadaceae bacterium]